jgi:HK97 family phage portal protein
MKLRGLLGRLARAINEQDNPALYTPAWQVGRPVWNDWSVTKAITEGYKVHAIIYAIVRRLSSEASSVPWFVKRKVGDGYKIVDQHLAAKTLREPNEDYSLQDMMELLTLDLQLGGNGYWRTTRAGQSAEIWRLRPDRMKVIPGAQGVIAYEHTVGERVTRIEAAEVTHFRFFDPGNDYYGIGPLQATARVVDTDNVAIDWNKASLDNQARPSGVLVLKEDPTKAQKDAIREELDTKLTGPTRARRPAILYGGMEWMQFGMSPVEMDFLESRQWSAREICFAFRVQPEVIGMGDATYENKRQARRMMWEDAIIPDLIDVRSAMNLRLRPVLGTDVEFDFDLSQTPAVQEARKEKTEEARSLWAMGVSFNAINTRLGLGFDPIEGGDVGYLPITLMPVGAEPPPPAPARMASRSRRFTWPAANPRSAEERAAYWHGFERQRAIWERQIARRVSKRFHAERDLVVQAVKEGRHDPAVLIEGQYGEWRTLLTAVWQAVIEHFGGITAEALGMETGRSRRDVWNPWPAHVQQYVSTQVASKVVGITDTTRDMVREAVAEGMAANLGTDEIASSIEAIYEEFDRYRSYVIARTEVGGAANYGSHEAARDSGVAETHIWISSRDDRVRELHQELDGEEVPLDEPFSNGLPCPGGEGPPEEVINCRCVEAFGTAAQGE